VRPRPVLPRGSVEEPEEESATTAGGARVNQRPWWQVRDGLNPSAGINGRASAVVKTGPRHLRAATSTDAPASADDRRTFTERPGRARQVPAVALRPSREVPAAGQAGSAETNSGQAQEIREKAE
jgi:hypothetical protein